MEGPRNLPTASMAQEVQISPPALVQPSSKKIKFSISTTSNLDDHQQSNNQDVEMGGTLEDKSVQTTHLAPVASMGPTALTSPKLNGAQNGKSPAGKLGSPPPDSSLVSTGERAFRSYSASPNST
jgi:hypothetical protein